MSKTTTYRSLFVFILICFGIEVIGSLSTHPSLEPWYSNLSKPSWTPPDWVFGPVWTLLYFLIAIAGWLVYQLPSSPKKKKFFIFYSLQLFCNAIWSFLFFYLQNPLFGLIDLTLIVLLLLATMYIANSLSKKAFLLLLPYLLWSFYAWWLNFAIYQLN